MVETFYIILTNFRVKIFLVLIKSAAYRLLLDRKYSQFTQYLAHPNSSYNYLKRPKSY